MLRVNWQRGVYLALFFCNAVFATLFRSLGDDVLGSFGTFRDCDGDRNASCRGNQMIFRASFCISAFFLVQALMSRFGSKTRARRCLTYYFITMELVVYTGLLVGSFFVPGDVFSGYSQFARVASGLFILFQIISIIGASYEARDFFLDRIANAEGTTTATSYGSAQPTVWGSTLFWKLSFLGCCGFSLIVTAIGLAYLYLSYGGCGIGVAFTTVTAIVAAVLLSVCVAEWMDVGLLPPCIVSAYLVLMCWQALTSSPRDTCRHTESTSLHSDNSGSVVANALIASFAITWTSWRSSSAASNMFAQASAVSSTGTRTDADESRIRRETPQFHCMMVLAGVYMAMVLTDWDSADGSSNGTSMWVKIVAQWLTMLLFAWTLAAPKLFPDRDFTG